MKIYGDMLSGNCLKVKYTADHFGIPYTWVAIDIMNGESRTEAFLARNPAGQVPVLELDDGRVLAQSNAIIQYLAEGSSLLPTEPYARGQVNEMLFWEQHSHEPYVAECRFVMRYLGKPAAAREDWRVARGDAALDYMDGLLAGRSWLAAGQFTVADIALLAYTRLAPEGGFELAGRESLVAWIGRCEAILGLENGASLDS
jgi:glutathione S-transferase